MEAVQVVITIGSILLLLLVPIAFVVRAFMAVFSSEGRRQLRKRWVADALWFGISIFILTVMVAPLIRSRNGIHVALSARTSANINQIQTAILSYQTEYDVPPPGKDNATLIRELMSDNPRSIAFLNLGPKSMNDKGEALDAWGTPLRIDITDPQHPLIQSAGPDKKWNTPDDMNNSKN